MYGLFERSIDLPDNNKIRRMDVYLITKAWPSEASLRIPIGHVGFIFYKLIEK